LLSAAVVPTFGPSLSQELAAARWRFRLLPQAFAPTPERWQVALDALLAAETLVWHDTDKKGRPRQRDCRADLLGLELLALESSGSITLQLQAAIDSAGRSIRPEQVGHWLAERLDGALMLQRVRREALLLKPC
jgi:hypothetical protein